MAQIYVKVKAFEESVWKIEKIRIVVRSPAHDSVKTYTYKKRAPRTWSLNELWENRIKKFTDRDIEFIKGDGSQVKRISTTLNTVQKSYKK